MSDDEPADDDDDKSAAATTTPSTTTTGNMGALLLLLQTWKEKLVTRDDLYHHHKILGVLALCSMAFRFAAVFLPAPDTGTSSSSSITFKNNENSNPQHPHTTTTTATIIINASDMGFVLYPQLTAPTLLLHGALAASSLQFRIPARRIRDGGRIWPEYRLHACVFTVRSLAIIALYAWEQQQQQQQSPYSPPNCALNYLILVGGMVAADAASWWCAPHSRSRSVRGLDVHPAVRFFFSFMQFSASAGLLYGLRRCTLPFLVLFVVQTTPFVATLRRKNLFTSNGAGAAVYGGMLLLSAVLVQIDNYHTAGTKTVLVIRTVGQLAALQRMAPPLLPLLLQPVQQLLQNKYVVWTCMFLLVRHVRRNLDEIPIPLLQCVWALSLALCVALGYYKTQNDGNSDVTAASPKIKNV